MIVEHGQESDDHARDGTGMEKHMGQLHVDGLHTAAKAVHQDGCKDGKGRG